MAKIGIDARMFAQGFGIGRYVEQLVIHLLKQQPEHDYTLIIKPECYSHLEHMATKHGLDLAAITLVETDTHWYTVGEQTRFCTLLRGLDLDLMHFPHWNVPLLYRRRYVVTVHDLIMFHYPRPQATTHGPLVYKVKDALHRLVLSNALKTSQHILVPTAFVRQDLMTTLGVSSEDITVTKLAPFFGYQNGLPKSPDQVDPHSPEGRFLAKYQITRPFAMYAGSAYPHKNLSRLLDAWKHVHRVAPEYDLVLVGKESTFYDQLKPQIARTPHVKYTGFLTNEELRELYGYASLYVFPSLYEGFGLPPLEAMCMGVPVVSSNRSCMPEVFGDAALYIDPEDTNELTNGILRGLTDKEARAYLRQAAKELLPHYSWDTTAKETLAVYEHILQKI
jgi:glycosyltransferase involved in cell wall biosynthesis